MAERKDVLVIGPRAPAVGGIATYVETMLELIPTHHFDTPPAAGSLRKLARFVRGCVFIISHRSRCRVLHLHSSYGSSFHEKAVFAALGRWLGYRSILHIHGSRFEEFVAQSRSKAWIAYSLRRADAVIALSESWAQFLTVIAPGSRIITLENAVTVPPAPMPVPAKPIVLLLGAINDRKGVPEAIHAFVRVIQEHPEAILNLAGPGEGEALERYNELIESLELQRNVRFVGSIRGEDKRRVLTETNVFILPSHAEGLPIALLEAMAAGRPVIATRVGGIPELLTDGDDGYLIAAGDVDALAERICRLLGSGELRERMGQAAWRRVHDRYNIVGAVKRLNFLYEELSGRRVPPASLSAK